jgi:hypothetical protein
MRILIFTLVLLTSCGKDVKFTNQLESNSAIMNAQPIAITQSAVIIRGTNPAPGKIIVNGRNYNISPFSSYVALNFINQQAMGMQIPVKIRGEVKGTEVYIKVIE